MPYYVVNVGRGRATTHISKGVRSAGLIETLATGQDRAVIGQTLCGLGATRLVEVFPPAEATCRECKRRWQLEIAAEAAKTPEQREREERSAGLAILVGLVVVMVVFVLFAVYVHVSW
jgi:hypothetical protein